MYFSRLFTFKIHIVSLLLIFAFSGISFAFILEQHWPRIQQMENQIAFPFSYDFFYILCVLSYLTQGIAFIILSKSSKQNLNKQVVPLFWGQFILNFLWLGLFFGLKAFNLAFLELLIALLMFLITVYFFYAYQRTNAFLLLPSGFLICLMIFCNSLFCFI